MNLADKVTTYRKSQGLSQEDLADLSQISLRTIQRIEGGKSIPRGYTLKSLAQALGKPVEEFAGQEEAEAPSLPVAVEQEVAQPEVQPMATSPGALTMWLQQLNIASFAFLVLPYLGFLVPLWLWRKQPEGSEARVLGARVVNFQVLWCVGMHLGLLLALGVQLALAYYFQVKLGFLVLGTFFFFYALNIVAILYGAAKLRTSQNLYSVGFYLFG
ncbi:helix-turn-helix domain-containing protein [Nibribacter koreensis]